jgi:hypothetical protein
VENSEESMRMERVRTCVFRIMLAMSVVDLSAHSHEAAGKEILYWTTNAWGRHNEPEIAREAALRIPVCLPTHLPRSRPRSGSTLHFPAGQPHQLHP